ncbi:GNAT family N-acetyltransferase [Brevibacillus sp. SYSU BS000544]|uniref:GNAT family N-acetyltransferase n=1 Tax=Brevibacillus sp. SYSU BS000544 TaxID=3416443 RepID=UPI003CE47082
MIPTIETERMILRPFILEDASTVQVLAGDREVAKTTLHIPHPYPDGAAEQWIARHSHTATKGGGYVFAITKRPWPFCRPQAVISTFMKNVETFFTENHTSELMGCISILIDQENHVGELGYWLGKPYWQNGYTTEAAERVLQFGFEELKLNRIYACAMQKNKASTSVMQKIGLKYEGTMAQAVYKWGVYEDVSIYGRVRSE